jgi:hypothetical protein
VIPATVASSHVRQATTVEGVISQVHTARSGKVPFVDVAGMCPNQIFSAVIIAPAMPAVRDVSDLTGRTVDVKGTIQIYQGRPEVIITSRAQIWAK